MCADSDRAYRATEPAPARHRVPWLSGPGAYGQDADRTGQAPCRKVARKDDPGRRPEDRKGVRAMAASLITEEESGTSRGTRHPHNGYYAGDFRQEAAISPSSASISNRPF